MQPVKISIALIIHSLDPSLSTQLIGRLIAPTGVGIHGISMGFLWERYRAGLAIALAIHSFDPYSVA